MTHWARAFAAKPDSLSMIPRALLVESPDLHTHTHTLQIKEIGVKGTSLITSQFWKLKVQSYVNVRALASGFFSGCSEKRASFFSLPILFMFSLG